MPPTSPRARALAADVLERAHQPRRRLGLAERVEHQRGAPDRAHRVRDPLAGDVGRRAVHRLEDPASSRSRARRYALAAMPMPPCSTAAMSVSTSPNRFEATTTSRLCGVADHPRGERVDEHALELHVRDARPRPPRRPRPRARSRSASAFDFVALVTTPRRPSASSNAYSIDAAHAGAREHARLDPDLELEPLVRAAADAGVLALGVLAHEEHVDRAAAPSSCDGTPSSRRAGRRFAQRSSPWRSGSSSPQSVTWSGTDGSPTAPSRTAS